MSSEPPAAASVVEPQFKSVALEPDQVFKPATLRGSCHCGNITYVVTVMLPTAAAPAKFASAVESQKLAGGQRIYKCNCTTCHKRGFFHVRPNNAIENFYVLTPVDENIGTFSSKSPAGEDGLDGSAPRYTCYTHTNGWRFCSKCGCSPFASAGTYQVIEKEVDVPGGGGGSSGGTEKRKVWKLHPDTDRQNSYLSVNLYTIDAYQPGFDLRVFHEKGMIEYLEILKEGDRERGDHPYLGGLY